MRVRRIRPFPEFYAENLFEAQVSGNKKREKTVKKPNSDIRLPPFFQAPLGVVSFLSVRAISGLSGKDKVSKRFYPTFLQVEGRHVIERTFERLTIQFRMCAMTLVFRNR